MIKNRVAVFSLGLIFGVLFSVPLLQNQPIGNEAKKNEQSLDPKFAVIEEAVATVISELIHDDLSCAQCIEEFDETKTVEIQGFQQETEIYKSNKPYKRKRKGGNL